MKKKPPSTAVTLKLIYETIREHNSELGKQLDNNEITREEYQRASFPPLAIPIIEKKLRDYREEVIQSYKEAANAR
tara:strand:+ start:102 stop:329 length:228 start_codon:yes stop_codon:yes gene_type:complete